MNSVLFIDNLTLLLEKLKPFTDRYSIYIISYIIAINILSLLLYGADKIRSMSGKWRISEKNLILSAVFFGSLGALCGMILFHHKTKHLKFTITVPILLIIQCLLFWFLIAI